MNRLQDRTLLITGSTGMAAAAARRLAAEGGRVARRIESTESRYAADRYALDVSFEVEEAAPAVDEPR